MKIVKNLFFPFLLFSFLFLSKLVLFQFTNIIHFV